MSQDFASKKLKNEMVRSPNGNPMIETSLKYKMSERLTGHAKTLKFL